MKIPDSTQRWLRTIALLEKATINDIQGIAESVGFTEKRITKLIAQRWFELDPQHFFEACLSDKARDPSGRSARFASFDYLEFLAVRWPEEDFDAALTAFSRPDPHEHLDDAKSIFANHLLKVDLNKAIEVSLTLKTEFYESGLKDLKDAARKNPRAIAHTIFIHFHTQDLSNAIDSGPVDPFNPVFWTKGSKLIDSLAEVWGEINPTEALAFANSNETDQGQYLKDKVIKSWFANDHSAASDWLDLQDSATREKYQPVFVKSWATEDPQGALAWCVENLHSSPSFEIAVRNLIEGAREGDLTQASQLIPELENDSLRADAISQITRKWFSPKGFESIPTEAIDWVRDQGDSSTGRSAMQEASEPWARRDPDGMRAFLEEERSFEYAPRVYRKLIETLTNRDPVAALEWTATLGEHAREHSQIATNSWLKERPEAAIGWLRHSPENTQAAQAMRASIALWMNHESTAERLQDNLGSENRAWFDANFEVGR